MQAPYRSPQEGVSALADILSYKFNQATLPPGTTAIMVARTRSNVGSGDVVEVIAIRPQGLEKVAVVGGGATVTIPLWEPSPEIAGVEPPEGGAP